MRVALVGGDAGCAPRWPRRSPARRRSSLDGGGRGRRGRRAGGRATGRATAEERCAALSASSPASLLRDRLLAATRAARRPPAPARSRRCRRGPTSVLARRAAAPSRRRTRGCGAGRCSRCWPARAGRARRPSRSRSPARSAAGVALLDLDLAGGSLAPRLGIAPRPARRRARRRGARGGGVRAAGARRRPRPPRARAAAARPGVARARRRRLGAVPRGVRGATRASSPTSGGRSGRRPRRCSRPTCCWS